MSWVITGSQPFPAVIGEAFGGGYFAGYISHTADGNPTHALIVAPRATGATGSSYTLTTNLQWKTTNTSTANTNSAFDGAANTAAMVAAGIADHPAAQFCVNLAIGGYSDWYLPSRLEYDIAYFNLKPTISANVAGSGNMYSVPMRTSGYTATYPSRTSLINFNTTSQGFASNYHWSSTQISAATAWSVDFNVGEQSNTSFIVKSQDFLRVRAFRRIAL
jgi:hypothetical protein